MPTYTGTSIEAKPPRLKRGEKLHRKIHQKAFRDYVPTLLDAHRAVAAWFDEYSRRPQTGHLNGGTPLEVFEAGKGPGVEKAQLNFLMMSEKIRTINRNGISFLSSNYYDPTLYGRKHPVLIRYDFQDLSSVLVYLKEGEFLCEAKRVEKAHPAACILGTKEDQEKFKSQIRMKKELLRQTTAPARAFAEAEIIPQVRKTMEQLGLPEVGKVGPESLKIKSGPFDVKLTEGKRRRIQQEVRQLEYYNKVFGEEAEMLRRLPKMRDPDRYEKLLELEVKGVDIPSGEKTFMRYFERSPEFGRLREYFEQFKLKMTLLYGDKKAAQNLK